MSGLVPGRECGECAVCCSALNIDTPEFSKVAGVSCQYATATNGCSIHATRFPVCREWFCVWRRMKELDDWWRPDRSGVLVYVTDSGIPAHLPRRTGLILKLVGDAAVLEDARFTSMIMQFIQSGVALFLAVPGAPGYESSRAFLNDGLAAAVHSGNRVELVDGLKRAHAAALATPRNKVVLGRAAVN